MAADGRRSIFTIQFLVIFLFFNLVESRKHHLQLETDTRRQFSLSSFGFLKHGTLTVNVTNFFLPKDVKDSNYSYGFTLEITSTSGASGYMDYADKCILEEKEGDIQDVKKNSLSVIFFKMDFIGRKLIIERRGKVVKDLIITNQTVDKFWQSRPKREVSHVKESLLSDTYLFGNKISGPRERREAADKPPKPKKHFIDKTTTAVPSTEKAKESKDVKDNKVNDDGLKVSENISGDANKTAGSEDKGAKGVGSEDKGAKAVTSLSSEIIKELPMPMVKEFYSFYFLVAITDDDQEGFYTLTFHNCDKTDNSGVSFTIDIVELNDNNYLSATDMPLPTMYFALSIVYVAMAILWNIILCKSKEVVYKIHYLMLVVVFVKSLACLFHAINSHFIAKEGLREEAWAVLFYIAYLMRGALLFVTFILIGAGWAFIKHVLSDREKKLFLIVIPLQILDNIAMIIVEESEQGESQYATWKEIFILIDLLCCGAILFPVVWSIKHLQDASHADGKEMLSLTKLKLFRQFYILVVCYFYFTRIIVYLLKMTVPFKYEWLNELSRELATILFFVVTAYKFKPAADNPYLRVPTEDDEEMEMDEVIVGKSATLDSVKKVNQGHKDETSGPKLRESSHEYD